MHPCFHHLNADFLPLFQLFSFSSFSNFTRDWSRHHLPDFQTSQFPSPLLVSLLLHRSNSPSLSTSHSIHQQTSSSFANQSFLPSSNNLLFLHRSISSSIGPSLPPSVSLSLPHPSISPSLSLQPAFSQPNAPGVSVNHLPGKFLVTHSPPSHAHLLSPDCPSSFPPNPPFCQNFSTSSTRPAN